MTNLQPQSKRSLACYLAVILPYIFATGLAGILIYCHYYGRDIADPDRFRLTDEDGWAEWGSCLAFALLGILALLAIVMKRDSGRQQKILLIVLAIGSFVAIGEELSWGQRIFDFSPPDSMKSKDGSGVTFGHNDVTAHNLSFELGPLKFSIGGMLFGLPLIAALAFHSIYLPWRVGRGGERTKRFVKRIGLFLPPVHLGLLLVFFTIFFRVSRKSWANKTDSGEFMELLIPAMYLIFLLYCFFGDRRRSSKIVTVLTLLILIIGLLSCLHLATY